MDTLKRMGSIAVQAVASTALMKRLVMAMPAAALVGFLGISLAASNAFGAFIQGPVDASGFPTYVQDGNGLRLAQCLDPGGGCGLAAEILPLFPVYWSAQARMATYGGKGGNPDASRPGGAATATLTMQLGGSYTINPVTGERDPSGTPIVLQSLQLQIDGLRDGFDYTGTTPFGVLDALTANVETDAFGRTTNTDAIKVVFEAELGVVDPFGGIGGLDNFLTCADGTPLPGFLGNMVLGALAECTGTGSPAGFENVFRLAGSEVGGGPNLWAEYVNQLAEPDSGDPDGRFAIGLDGTLGGGPGPQPTTSVDTIETNQFVIVGQVVSVPEPGAGWLVLCGLAGLAGYRGPQRRGCTRS